MQIPLRYTKACLAAAGCIKSGVVIDDKTIEISLAAAGAKQYVLPQIEDDKDNLKLTFTVSTFGEEGEPAPSTETFKKDQYGTISGRIARGVLERVGAKLDDMEIEQISAIQISSADE